MTGHDAHPTTDRRDDMNESRNEHTTKHATRIALGTGTVAGAILAILIALVASGSASTLAAAPVNVTLPSIGGTAAQGSTLTASSGSWTGDTPIAFAFQWRACNVSGASCSDIAGATGQTYTVGASEVGSTLRISVVGTNASGTSTALSQQTAAIAAASPPVNTAAPAVSGSAQAGQILVTSDGTWSGSPPPTFTYQWQRCNSAGSSCATLSGQQTSTYAVVAADVGSTIRTLVTATNGVGAATAQSAQTAVVVSSGSAPRATAQGTVTGTLSVGNTLTVSTGWSGTSPIAYSFQWQRCDSGGHCVSISGATGQTYVATGSDVGYRLRALVTGRNAFGSSSLYSNLSAAAVAATGSRPVLVVAPAVTGATKAGGVLIASNGSWSSSTSLRYAYAWLRCDAQGNACSAVSGATGQSWTVPADAAGHSVRVQVTAINGGGSTAAQSIAYLVASAPVAAGAPSGLIALGNGVSSIAVTAVSLPQRLIISGVSFSPSRVTSRAPFTARFRVTDTRGYAVRGALVYIVTLPYGLTAPAAEVTTDNSGYATITVRPTSAFPLRRGALVMFVRARKPGGDLLAGISTRRLVQVLIGS
jgi:hypothetical protein